VYILFKSNRCATHTRVVMCIK